MKKVSKYNRNIIERDKIDTGSTQIHDRSLLWLGTTTHTNTWSLTVLAWHNHSQIHDRSLFLLGTTTHKNTWLLTVLAWYNHSLKYMIAHCSGLVQPLTQIHYRSLLLLGTNTHTNTWSLFVLAWYNHLNGVKQINPMNPPWRLWSINDTWWPVRHMVTCKIHGDL